MLGRSAVPEEILVSLGELQRAALKARIPVAGTRWRPDLAHVDDVADLVRARGFEPIGIGRTRFAIKLDDPPAGELVAKLAWDPRGLVYNVHEAAVWIESSDDVRCHLAPCVCITDSLILLQRCATPIAPPLLSSDEHLASDALDQREDLAREWMDAVNEVRRGLGVDEQSRGLRLDNYGLVNEQLVAIDFDYRPATEEAIGWIYEEARAGPVRLDEESAERFREVARSDEERLWPLGGELWVSQYTEAAGWDWNPIPCPDEDCTALLPCPDHRPESETAL